MRCRKCNELLNDKEVTWKDYQGKYIDTCSNCLYGFVSEDFYEHVSPDDVDEDVWHLTE